MTKKKNLIARICGLLIVLTLISCCFLGTTFARYTSSGDGTASVTVAKWDIDITGGAASGATALALGTLSPSDAAWKEGPARTHEMPARVGATIVNSSAVNADITVELANVPTFTGTAFNADSSIQEGADVPSYAEAYNTIKVQVFISRDSINAPASDAEGWVDYNGSATIKDVAGNGGTVYIWVRAIWMSQDSYGEANADKLDTWLGENITTVSVGITYTAVQSSMQP